MVNFADSSRDVVVRGALQARCSLATGANLTEPLDFAWENSIAFGKSTSQRIYPAQHTPKIG